MIQGKVVDTEGRPAAGAWVVVYHHDGVATANHKGEYAFDDLPTDFPSEFTLRATDGKRASWPITVDWKQWRVRAPDLVLQPGVPASVVVRWNDGTPAADVKLWSMVHENARDDHAPPVLSYEGATNEDGTWRFGPVPATADSVFAEATHPDGPPIQERWDGPIDGPLELTLYRGRAVRGQLVTPEGAPGAGYRVAPYGPGDPSEDRVVTADADGRFEIPAADPRGAVIVVYPPLPQRIGDDEHDFCVFFDEINPTGPLLFKDAPPDHANHDFGTIELPVVGTLTLQIEDTTGNAARSGHVFWQHANQSHGGRGHEVDPNEGTVRIENVPLGTAVRIRASIDDASLGEIQQSFHIPCVTEEPERLRLTGAGNVIVRLHPKGSPNEPLLVRNGWAEFGP